MLLLLFDPKMRRRYKRSSSGVGGIRRLGGLLTLGILLSFQLVIGSETKGSDLNDAVVKEGADVILGASAPSSPANSLSSISSSSHGLLVPSTEEPGVSRGEQNIRVDNDVQNILEGRRRGAVFLPKNVDKADFMPKVTDTAAKESKESPVNREEESAGNGSITTATTITTTTTTTSSSNSPAPTSIAPANNNHSGSESSSKDSSNDGTRAAAARAVNPSPVTKTVTNPKTEAEASNRGEEETSTLLVLQLAQCRANCVQKKNEKMKKHQRYSIYSKKMDVSTSKLREQIKMSYDECWDTCLLLEIENGENHHHHHVSSTTGVVDVICSLNNNSNTCLSGCQDACEFHHYVQHVAKNGTKPPLLAATKVESFLTYNLTSSGGGSSGSVLGTNGKRRGGGRVYQLDLQWPGSETASVVYSVVQHVRLKNVRLGWTWRLLEQTTMTKISLTFSERPKIGDIRVLAATARNLVHVFSQERMVGMRMKVNVPTSGSSSSSSRGATSGASSAHHEEGRGGELVKEKKIANVQEHGGAEEDETHHQHQPPPPQDPWHLRKVSMVHQKFLVVTEITWDVPGVAEQGEPKDKSQTGTLLSTSFLQQQQTHQQQQQQQQQQEGGMLSPSNAGTQPPPPSLLPPTPATATTPPHDKLENNSHIEVTHKSDSASHETPRSSQKSKHGTKPNFLLTWEVSGGILRGNMVTDTNTVTISLWPDTIYSIQVGLIEEEMNGERQGERLNPWEYEVEPKVTIKSSLLSVNTSDAVYLPSTLTEEDEESDANSKSDSRGSKSLVSSKKSSSSSSSSSSTSSHSPSESISSSSSSRTEARIPLTAAEAAHTPVMFQEGDEEEGVVGVNDNDHIRNSTTLTSLKCELASGATKWLCQLSISWLVILCSIYGLLFLFALAVYLFFAFKHYPGCWCQSLVPCSQYYNNYYSFGSGSSSSDGSSKSTCKLQLLPHEEEQQHEFPHVRHSDTELRPKDLDILSQYNIV